MYTSCDKAAYFLSISHLALFFFAWRKVELICILRKPLIFKGALRIFTRKNIRGVDMENENIIVEETQKKEGAGTRLTQKIPFKKRFTTKRIALMAVFVALSFAVSFLEIPLPLFGASFLKLDFGNVFIVLISFLLGPMEGVIICLLKEGLRCLTSSSMCAGELANFLITSSYLLLPSILYQRKKTLKTVIISLSAACLIATGVALLCNRLIIFPAFSFLFGGSIYGMTVQEAFAAFWVALLIFNLIKTVAIGVLTLLLYKRLSNFLKKIKI
ncbi:MAG: ECF transporter S component [Clostridiales bacterium]|nr:ECF transporter S component [Clostridiales bacterium]